MASRSIRVRLSSRQPAACRYVADRAFRHRRNSAAARLGGEKRYNRGSSRKGLILAEQNKVAEAIEVFTALARDYPELPEPYNNLAVLYANQGQYEKARQQLEMSIRTHPSYATAYENLGDVYTKLASQAYDKALQFDSSNSAAKNKLSLIRDLMSSNRLPRASSAPSATPVESAQPPAAKAVPTKSADQTKLAAEIGRASCRERV